MRGLVGLCLSLASALLTIAHASGASSRDLDSLLRSEAQTGGAARIEELVRAGANVNSRGPYGENALYYATLFGRVGAALKLIELGADPNLQDELGRTPLLRASESCDYRSLRALLKAGARINHEDAFGRTALINAVEANCVRNVALLLSNRREKPDLDARDHSFRGAEDYVHHPYIEAMLRLARGIPVGPSELPPGLLP